MKRRDDPFERDSFWPDGDFNMAASTASSMVEDLNARRDYFLRGRGGGPTSATSSAFSDLGAFSSVAPSTSTSFPYSQKNFHISDGNLYSVLSPFQARKSSARPAFLRGQSCLTSTSITNSNSSASGSSFANSSCSVTVGQRQQQQQQEHGSNRRSKLKFHHQEMPPPYGERNRRHPRGKLRQSDGEGDPPAGDSGPASWCESAFEEDPFARLRSDEDFLLSKRLKSPRREHFRRTRDEECESDEVRHRLFRDTEWNSEDISRSFSHHRIRRSNRSCSSTAFSGGAAGAEDDDAGPLNLCLADYRQKIESRIRKDFESDCESRTLDDAESDTESFPFHQWSGDRKFGLSELFDGFPTRSKFQRNDEGSGGERSRTFEDEPRVLDLSTKERAAKSAALGPSSHFLGERGCADPFYVQNCQMPSTEAETKSKKYAPISEMLENMRLQDADDFRHHALKRYLSARERLMHTHPEMFGGWERETVAGETEKPYDAGRQPFVPNKETLSVFPKAPDRPRSWDVTPGTSSRLPNVPTTPEPADQSRPDSAEPCLETGPFAPGVGISFSVEEAPESEPKRMAKETYVGAETGGAPVPAGPVLCSSCPEVPSLGAGAIHSAKLKPHPKMKIKSESAIGGAAQRTKIRQLRKSSSGGMAESQSSQFTNQDISICKFKLTKGVHPVLEEKKSFFVPMLRPPTGQTQQPPCRFDEGASCSGMPNPHAVPPFAPSPRGTGAPPTADKFRTFKIHVGSQEEMGRKLTCGKRLRRRSQKALVREKLEATFREQGFLIKTQQVSSAEGAVYCKFRQLKKFTRYLYKSWKDHLPKELDDISKAQMQAKEAKLTK